MTTLKDIGSALAQIAPTVAGLLGGPLAVAGVTTLEKVLGITPDPNAPVDQRQQAVLSAMAVATPEQLIALKQADNALREKMIEAGVVLEQTDAADRASARGMQTATKDSTPRILTYVIAAACAGISAAIVGGFSPAFKDTTTAATVGTIVGYLFGELKAATSFWFGTTRGSEEKNALINKALDANPPTQ